VLTEGSVYELLRRDPRIEFDPHIAHAGLIYDDASRAVLADVHAAYIEIARERGLPIIAFADTWRASAARIAMSPFRGRAVNRDNIEFLRGVAAESSARVFFGALIGPRGDAYRPEEAPSMAEAIRDHAAQIDDLSEAGAEIIIAATLPSFGEARGIATLLARTEKPWMLSFVVRPAGVILDGTPLENAVREIDASVPKAPIGYSINCVHPDIARQSLSRLSPEIGARFIAFQGNASARTPEELDNLPHVDRSDAPAFAASMQSLVRGSSMRIVGGCCGTDVEHMRAVAAGVLDIRH
jgi:homocysteine S-methyltransferase